MFHKILGASYYESRMSFRGWRFWLLLFLMVGISFFARQDYLALAKQGFFLHAAFSFQHPSFWLMLTVIYLGAVALALDTCSRLRRTHMDKILFPLPVTPMQLMWGRFFGVLLMIVPLSAIGLFSLGMWQMMYGHGMVVWQPFFVAYAILILPVVIPATAITITMRTFFKHDFAALLAGSLVVVGLVFVGNQTGTLMNLREPIERLAESSPTIGVRLAFSQYWIQFAAHAVISVTILYLAPLYLRRQEPQRWIISRHKKYRLFAVPTLLRWISNLRFDSHLGWTYRLSLVSCILFSTVGALWAAYHYQEMIDKREELRRLEKINKENGFSSSHIDVKHLRLDVNPYSSPHYLHVDAAVTFEANEEIKSVGFELDPRFVVEKVTLGDLPCPFNQRAEQLRIAFIEAPAKGEEHTLVLSYHRDAQELYPLYSALEGKWYPESWNKILTRRGQHWTKAQGDLFDAEITIHLRQGQTGAFAGELVSAENQNGKRVEVWRTFYPVDALQMYWGAFEFVEEAREGYRVRFYHLPHHNYQSRVYLEEIKEQEQYVVAKLGRLPFPQLTLIETPYEKPRENLSYDWYFGIWGSWRGSTKEQQYREIMPGLLLVSENLLSYMHERMWLLERMDRDPRTIPFFQQLPSTLRFLHDQFYNRLISVYFDQSLHPTGDLSFWLRDYLSGYASKLLERNQWRRRGDIRFDVGTRIDLPIVVAKEKSLQELHKDGLKPNLERLRGEGLFRMIHHLLGEEKWWALIKDIFREFRFREAPVEEFWQRVEASHGEDLSWFLHEWILGVALPEYEITYAEAKIRENKEKFRVDYDVTVTVKNHGTGRMGVPIFIETEMDYVFRNLWLDAGNEASLTVTVPNRPLFAAVDPEHWVLQIPFYDAEKRTRNRSEKRIYIEGDDRSKGQRRRMDHMRGHRHFRW
ncbi:MAG: hypothetical protein C4527_05335 [Candidatus Omnitrophota bacterium]|jgi:ABC-type transport system involved in multi-copper enzyme maturation permease subunit|nr:MAG: hypothetical protein C4527_05335 [Candidatus Omnitrophota bacterium]